MKRIAYILPNYSMCREKFNKIIGNCIDMGLPHEVMLSPMRVVVGDIVEYSFVHDTGRLMGLRLDTVFMDELVSLTEEQKAFVQSRIKEMQNED